MSRRAREVSALVAGNYDYVISDGANNRTEGKIVISPERDGDGAAAPLWPVVQERHGPQ